MKRQHWCFVVAIAATMLQVSKAHVQSINASSWTRPPTCHGDPTYEIQIHWVELSSDNNRLNETVSNTTGPRTPKKNCPKDLKDAVQVAADMWSRAILSKESAFPIFKDTRVERRIRKSDAMLRACGFQSHSMNENTLLVCVRYESFGNDHADTLGNAQVLVLDEVHLLPLVAQISLNSDHSKVLSACDWANVAFHEIAHALGFGTGKFMAMNVIGQHRKVFCGFHALREWKELNTALSRPPLDKSGYSHWSPHCFQDEIMLPHLPGRGSDRRVPLSRLTLATFADIGYKVNYNCSDKVSVLQASCTPGRHPSRATKLRWKLRRTVRRVKKHLFIRLRRKFRITMRRVKKILHRQERKIRKAWVFLTTH